MNNKLELIKQLRQRTQAGFLDCQKALQENNQNLEESIKWLRIKGMVKAANKNLEKLAYEGTTWAAQDEKGAALLELNTQTDFTGHSPKILDLAKKIIALILQSQSNNIVEVLAMKLNDLSVEESLLEASHQTGEKISLRRIYYLLKKDNHCISSYRHSNGKISALVEIESVADKEIIKGLSMHAAAMKPKFIDQNSVDSNWKKQEQQVIEAQLVKENKPLQFAKAIIEGRLRKAFADVCFLEQEYIFDTKKTVGTFLQENKLKICCFKYFELGEGIEKVEVNFAKEVVAQMK